MGGFDDPIREYSPDENHRLTEHLRTLAEDVCGGVFSNALVDRRLLCELHRRLFDGVRRHAGRHRSPTFGSDRLVFGPNRSVARADVPARVDAVLGAAERSARSFADRSDDPDYDAKAIHAAVWTHAEIIRIHPFEDGNGRTSRLLMGAMLVRLGLRPIPIEACKQEYADALNHYFRQRDIQPLVDLFLRLYPAAR